jgi:hypothetical protein
MRKAPELSSRDRFGFKELAPHGIPLAATRNGDLWVADIYQDGSWHQVLFFGHDPPVLVVQFASLHDFIEEIANHADAQKRAEALVSQVYKKSGQGWRAGELTNSLDLELATFAGGLPANYGIFDLRKAPVPAGFVWSKRGASTDSRRAGRACCLQSSEQRGVKLHEAPTRDTRPARMKPIWGSLDQRLRSSGTRPTPSLTTR